jgi:hypothetical protein
MLNQQIGNARQDSAQSIISSCRHSTIHSCSHKPEKTVIPATAIAKSHA